MEEQGQSDSQSNERNDPDTTGGAKSDEDLGAEISKQLDPKLVFSIVSSNIMQEHFNRLARTVLAWLGIPSVGALLIGAWYVIEVVPEQAQSKALAMMDASIMTTIQNEKEAVDKKRDEMVDTEARVKTDEENFKETDDQLKKQSQSAQSEVAEIQKQIGSLTDTRDNLQKQIDDLNKSLKRVSENPAVQQVLEKLGNASSEELTALAAGTPKGSLLLTMSACKSPWIPVDEARGSILIVQKLPAQQPAAPQKAKEWSITLSADNIPALSLADGITQTDAALTIQNLKFDGRKPPSGEQQFELNSCRDCSKNAPFAKVPVVLSPLRVGGTVGRSAGAMPVSLGPKQYSVELCRLK